MRDERDASLRLCLTSQGFPPTEDWVGLYSVGESGEIQNVETLVVDPPTRHGGRLVVPSGPGWGVEVDRDALDRFTTATTSITIDEAHR